ncbi:MAG: hypothetical protein WCO04_09695 [Pseudomonadota bacterium]
MIIGVPPAAAETLWHKLCGGLTKTSLGGALLSAPTIPVGLTTMIEG